MKLGLFVGALLMTSLGAAKTLQTITVAYDSFIGEKELNKAAAAWMQTHKSNGELKWTPYMPLTWPADGPAELITYGYLQQHDVHLKDGVKVSQPLLTVRFVIPEMLAQTQAKLEEIEDSSTLRFGTQGVRPLTKDEVMYVAKEVKYSWVDSSLTRWKVMQKMKGGLSPSDQVFFCFWSKTNGIIATSVMPQLQQFFVALNCPK